MHRAKSDSPCRELSNGGLGSVVALLVAWQINYSCVCVTDQQYSCICFFGYTWLPELDVTEQNGTGPTRSSPLSDTFPALTLWLHRVPGVVRIFGDLQMAPQMASEL